MSDHCFVFLESEFPDISKECEQCEKHLVEENYNDSLIHAGIACEFITKAIADDIGKPELKDQTQNNRLNVLFYKFMAISASFESSFHKIKTYRNKSAHGSVENAEDVAYQMHKRLYRICVWFYGEYGHYDDFDPKEYDGPVYKPLVRPEFEPENGTDMPPHSQPELGENNLSDYNFSQKNNSYLLNELFKLNVSSGESVENEDDLNEFKNYIHVDRSIQKDFTDELERVADEDSSHLVMLCGSVGDGKSHLLAHLKTHRPDLFNRFTIHGDATESYFTKKSDEDTLAEVLSSFNDDNIDSSSEKLILAINLGVLNNFLESSYCLNDYTKLREIIENANIFDSDVISGNIIQDKVSFITFSDYNLFELNGDSDSNYVSSDYISSLLEKITSPDNNANPFYQAYNLDKENGFSSPVIYNYEMLCDKEVQKVLTEYIIRVFVEQKKIISTRDLLNAIYELIVPPEIVDYAPENGIDEFIDYLLPNMMFSNSGRSDLLKFLCRYDPTLSRSKNIDNFIIKFNITRELDAILNEYFNMAKLEFLKDYFSDYQNLFDCSISGKQKLIKTLIRLAIFYGKSNFRNEFTDSDYLNYLKYLYLYNIQNHSQYLSLFLEIKKAIFELKGSFKKDYICIDELESFKVSKELKLKYSADSFDASEVLSNRFKTHIRVYFFAQTKNKIPLDVDYPLYSAICKLNNGFRPNKVEKENLILFEEFINNLVGETASEDLFIKNTDHDVDFTFEYNEDFDSFTFEKGG